MNRAAAVLALVFGVFLAIAEEHPELKRASGPYELVQEWLRLEDDLAH